jgi:hypothetical protein
MAMEKHSRSKVGYASVLDIDYDIDKVSFETTEEALKQANGYRGGWPTKEDSMPRFAFTLFSLTKAHSRVVTLWLRHSSIFICA